MRLSVRAVLCGCLVSMAAGAPTHAQGRPYGPIVLRLPASTRMLAMGNANTAGRDDDVVFYSPAQIAIARGSTISGERYSEAASGGALSTVTRIFTGGIALGVSWVTYESNSFGFPGTRAALNDPESLAGSSLEAVLGVAQTYKNIRFGVSGKYLADAFGERSQLLVADLGVGRDFSFAGINIGTALSIQNLGTGEQHFTVTTPGGVQSRAIPLPFRYSLGAAAFAPVKLIDVGVTTQLSVLRDGFVSPAGGVEVGYSWLDGYSLAGRVGARRPEDGEEAFTAGAGFSLDRISIDYALEALAEGHWGNRIGIRIR